MDSTTAGNWKDIAEIVALFALVATLVAVVVELRQTQVALQSQAYQARAFQAYDNHMAMAGESKLDTLFMQSWRDDFDPASLDEVDRNALVRIYAALLIDVDNEHYQYRNGLLDAAFYEHGTVRDIKQFAPRWRSLGMEASRPAFRAEVDRILADPSIAGWPDGGDTGPDPVE